MFISQVLYFQFLFLLPMQYNTAQLSYSIRIYNFRKVYYKKYEAYSCTIRCSDSGSEIALNSAPISKYIVGYYCKNNTALTQVLKNISCYRPTILF